MNALQITLNEDAKARMHDRKFNRFFQRGNLWYFKTREGIVMGPYDTLEVARDDVTNYIGFVQNSSSSVLRIMKLNSSDTDRITLHCPESVS